MDEKPASPPAVTTEQMVAVDRLMIEEYGISLLQMMENAGRNLAELARRLLGGRLAGQQVAVLCGSGNNGGGGLVAARHLHNWGAQVQVKLVSTPQRLKDVPALQWRILEAMGLASQAGPDLQAADLILDAMIGYGLVGNPRQEVAGWIAAANTSGRPVLSLDAPSGLDTTSGRAGNPCIHAYATLTLALPKTGLLEPAAQPYTGELYLADISVPPDLYRRLGLEVPPLFQQDTILKIG